jgi:hypothetical protein
VRAGAYPRVEHLKGASLGFIVQAPGHLRGSFYKKIAAVFNSARGKLECWPGKCLCKVQCGQIFEFVELIPFLKMYLGMV